MNAGLIGIATARFVYFYRQWTSHANEFKATVFHKAGRYKDIRVPKGGAIIEDKVYGAMQAISEVIVSDYRVIVLESRHQQNWSTVMNYVSQTAQQNGFSPFNNNNEVAWAMFSQKYPLAKWSQSAMLAYQPGYAVEIGMHLPPLEKLCA